MCEQPGQWSRGTCRSTSMAGVVAPEGSPLRGHEGCAQRRHRGRAGKALGHQVKVSVLEFLRVCDLRGRGRGAEAGDWEAQQEAVAMALTRP